MHARSEDITRNLSFADTAAWCRASRRNASQCTPLFWRLKAKNELGVDLDELFGADDPDWPYPAKYRWAEEAMNSFPFTTEAREPTFRNEILWIARTKRDFGITEGELGDVYVFMDKMRDDDASLSLSYGLGLWLKRAIYNGNISLGLRAYLFISMLANLTPTIGTFCDFMRVYELLNHDGLGKRILEGGIDWANKSNTIGLTSLLRLYDGGVCQTDPVNALYDFITNNGIHGFATLVTIFTWSQEQSIAMLRAIDMIRDRKIIPKLRALVWSSTVESKLSYASMELKTMEAAVRRDDHIPVRTLISAYLNNLAAQSKYEMFREELERYAARHFPMSRGRALL